MLSGSVPNRRQLTNTLPSGCLTATMPRVRFSIWRWAKRDGPKQSKINRWHSVLNGESMSRLTGLGCDVFTARLVVGLHLTRLGGDCGTKRKAKFTRLGDSKS